MKVLMTGGSGFVGRHFVKSFLDLDYDVTNVDNLLPGGGGVSSELWLPSPKKNYREFIFDCREFFERFANEKFDLVLHLAAVIGGRLTIERNPMAVADDLSIDSQFWSWAVKARPSHIICFSSSAAYPVKLQSNEQSVLLKESDIDFNVVVGIPDLTYGWAKLTHEYLAKVAHNQHNLNVTTYRPFSGYGEDQSLDYPFTSICKRAIESSTSGKMKVWGSGLQSRDFIHIDDVVKGVMSTYPKIVNGDALNLCTGKLTTFLDLARLACQAVGFNPTIEGDSSMPQGVYARGGDPKKLAQFGYTSSISIEDGIVRAIDYLRNRYN
jgi:GDP-L-fucose synthase